ncbi:MAG: hypothetical protein H0U22_07035 [Geodermatophilaceae bacterium]|nr:hypothetical protein [Geodermatophilaceae bacterium]
MEFRGLLYYELTSRDGPDPVNLFIVEASTGPTRGMRLDYPSMTWKFDPITVQYSLIQDIDQGENQVSRVDRTRAEEIALLLKTPLPSEAGLRKLMQDGAS